MLVRLFPSIIYITALTIGCAKGHQLISKKEPQSIDTNEANAEPKNNDSKTNKVDQDSLITTRNQQLDSNIGSKMDSTENDVVFTNNSNAQNATDSSLNGNEIDLEKTNKESRHSEKNSQFDCNLNIERQYKDIMSEYRVPETEITNILHKIINRQSEQIDTGLAMEYVSHSSIQSANPQDFEGLDLSNLNLDGQTLSNILIYGGTLENTLLRNATLKNVIFFGTNLKNTNFSNSHMNNVLFLKTEVGCLTGIEASEVTFANSTVNLSENEISKTYFYKSEVNLSSVYLVGGYSLETIWNGNDSSLLLNNYKTFNNTFDGSFKLLDLTNGNHQGYTATTNIDDFRR